MRHNINEQNAIINSKVILISNHYYSFEHISNELFTEEKKTSNSHT